MCSHRITFLLALRNITFVSGLHIFESKFQGQTIPKLIPVGLTLKNASNQYLSNDVSLCFRLYPVSMARKTQRVGQSMIISIEGWYGANQVARDSRHVLTLKAMAPTMSLGFGSPMSKNTYGYRVPGAQLAKLISPTLISVPGSWLMARPVTQRSFELMSGTTSVSPTTMIPSLSVLRSTATSPTSTTRTRGWRMCSFQLISWTRSTWVDVLGTTLTRVPSTTGSLLISTCGTDPYRSRRC